MDEPKSKAAIELRGMAEKFEAKGDQRRAVRAMDAARRIETRWRAIVEEQAA